MQAITERKNTSIEQFEQEIAPLNKPVVLKGLVENWPVVSKGLESSNALGAYINHFDNHENTNVCIGHPSINGRFFYNDNMHGSNFEIQNQSITWVIEKLLASVNNSRSPAIAMQAQSIPERLIGFSKENITPLSDKSLVPRIWIGNRVSIPTHYDFYDNLACVAAGHRRFTLFPPDQIENLYPGPLLVTPANTPVSMVDLNKPDLERYPRFSKALESAQQAYLEPGDAIYIPTLWWHAVDSLDSINILINYWWGGGHTDSGTPHECLMHSLLVLPQLPREQRKAWKDFFNYYVFRTEQDPTSHLPESLEDILLSLTDQTKKQLRDWLIHQLNEKNR